MRIAVQILATTVLCASPGFAKNDQVLRGPVPHWVATSELMPIPADASGLIFVRRRDDLVHLHPQGQEHFSGYRIKLLHPNALQLGNVAIAWNPAAGAPTVHFVRIHRGNEVIDILSKTSFEILRREDHLEAARLDGLLTAFIRIPDLRVGDELEVAMTVPGNDPTLKETSAGLLLFDSIPAAGRFRLGLNWADGQEPHLRVSPDLAEFAKRGQRSITIQLENPGPLAPPKDAPPRFRWQRAVEFSDFVDWPSLSRRFAPLYVSAAFLGENSPVKTEARRIAATHKDPFERASAALELVQQQVRYIYVGLNGGNLRPASAEETWQRRYGDCKAKTALLLSLLSELGIEAEAVLVSNSGRDNGFDARLPNPGLFDHVLVRARIDGSDYWLDGTLPPVAGPSARPLVPYEWVLPLTRQGNALEHIKWQPPQAPDEVNLFEIDARAGFDSPARITTTTVLRGIKGLEQHVQLSGLTQTQLLSVIRQTLTGDVWQKIDDATWRYDRRSGASVLTISGTGTIDWEKEGRGGRSYRLPGGGFSPPERRVRAVDEDQQVPFYNEDQAFTCHVTTVRLPSETKTEHWRFNTSFDARLFGRNYYRAFGQRDGAISMIRGSRIEQREIDVAAAKRDNGRIASFDNSMAVITYDPTSRSDIVNSAYVPATYEIDWAGSDVPCLATAATRLKTLQQRAKQE
jgi:transglutaminase-like putative cysteine protease